MNNINNLTDLQSLIVCIFAFIENDDIENLNDETELNFINFLTGFINGFEFINNFSGCGFDIENKNLIVHIGNEKILIPVNKIIEKYFLNGFD